MIVIIIIIIASRSEKTVVSVPVHTLAVMVVVRAPINVTPTPLFSHRDGPYLSDPILGPLTQFEMHFTILRTTAGMWTTAVYLHMVGPGFEN